MLGYKVKGVVLEPFLLGFIVRVIVRCLDLVLFTNILFLQQVVYHPSRMASRGLGPSLKIDSNLKSSDGAAIELCLPQQHKTEANVEEQQCQELLEPIFTASSIAVAVKRSNSWLNCRSSPTIVTHVF